MAKNKNGNGNNKNYIQPERLDRNKNRSDSYQWVLLEQACSPEMMTEVAEAKGMAGLLNPFDNYSEELLDLRDQLKDAFWRLAKEGLTTRQFEVLSMSTQGMTQSEVAKILNVNQSSITKSLNGNCDYKYKNKTTYEADGITVTAGKDDNGGGRRIYGGSIRKLRKLVEKDDEIQDILERISELS